MGDATDLNALAGNLLDACIAALDTIPFADATLEGAPERAFVSSGQPVLDCCGGPLSGQLTVHAAAVNDAQTTPGGLGAGKRPVQGKINHVLFLITIARCIPIATEDGNPPPVVELEAAAAQTNADVWALSNYLFDTAGEWSVVVTDSSPIMCGEVFFDGWRPLPPSNCGGWVGAVRVRLDGYQVP